MRQSGKIWDCNGAFICVGEGVDARDGVVRSTVSISSVTAFEIDRSFLLAEED